MKKLFALLSIVTLLLTAVACDEADVTDEDTQDPDSPAVTTTADPDGSATTPGATDPQKPNVTDPSKPEVTAPKTEEPADDTSKALILGEGGRIYEFKWVPTDETTGVLTMSEVISATEEDIAMLHQMGIAGDGPLEIRNPISDFQVTYTVDANGVYTVEGPIKALSISVTGGSIADAFIQWSKDQYADPDEIEQVLLRMLDGEVITDPDDIEQFTYEIDSSIKVTFSLENSKLKISRFDKRYTVWGAGATVSDEYYVENDVIRKFVEGDGYGMGSYTYEYRSDGSLEKELGYSSIGTLSSVTYYAEDGTTPLRQERYEEDRLFCTIYYDENGDEARIDYYDENGNIVDDPYSGGEDSDNENWTRENYDENGNLTSIDYYQTEIGLVATEYYENGVVVRKESFDTEGNMTVGVYSYNDAGVLMSITYYNEDSHRYMEENFYPDGNLFMVIYYDEKNLLSLREIYAPEGYLSQITYYIDGKPIYTNRYDKDGNLIDSVDH